MSEEKGVIKVISGGQTGADQAALRCARDLGLKTGGTAPRDFRTSTGKSPTLKWLYSLEELDCPKDTPLPAQYAQRSILNVRNSDGSFVFRITRSPGTDHTLAYCQSKNWGTPKLGLDNSIPPTSSYKPVFGVHKDLLAMGNKEWKGSSLWKKEVARAKQFLREHNIHTLNVFGHRSRPDDNRFEQRVYTFLKEVLDK